MGGGVRKAGFKGGGGVRLSLSGFLRDSGLQVLH